MSSTLVVRSLKRKPREAFGIGLLGEEWSLFPLAYEFFPTVTFRLILG